MTTRSPTLMVCSFAYESTRTTSKADGSPERNFPSVIVYVLTSWSSRGSMPYRSSPLVPAPNSVISSSDFFEFFSTNAAWTFISGAAAEIFGKPEIFRWIDSGNGLAASALWISRLVRPEVSANRRPRESRAAWLVTPMARMPATPKTIPKVLSKVRRRLVQIERKVISRVKRNIA